MARMSGRRGLVLIVCIVLVGGTIALSWPELVRQATIARVRALTGRPVTIGVVRLNLLTGRLTRG